VGKNPSAHAQAAHGNLTAFGLHKYSTGVNPLQADREAKVRKLSQAKGGVAGRALQVYQSLPIGPQSLGVLGWGYRARGARGKGKRIVTEISIGPHLIPDPSTMVM
jgi:hypothetical protein